MKKVQLGRRDILGRAGLALGGLVALGSLPGCDEEESCPTPAPASKVNLFPYDQHLATGYELDVAAVQEAAYHAYYAGGCCHGSYSALLGHLATTVGAPFDELPIAFGKFGAGGIDGYGSICGSLLGATLMFNMIVTDAAARKNMTWELMRWYEEHAFPSYVPADVDPVEVTNNPTLDFVGDDAGKTDVVKVAPTSHLCHASVSAWCNANGVSSTSADKKARCARLTADVAGRACELLNAYLTATPRAYALTAYSTENPDPNAGCNTCHKPAVATSPSVASDMTCVSCHGDKTTVHY